MIIFPAIDLYEKKAVRLFKGDYDKMTVYSDNPIELALDFEKCGASHIHMVDLEGAKYGTLPNYSVVCDVVNGTNLFVEIGGGIRNLDTIEKYLNAGVGRVILGTAAVNDEMFLKKAVSLYGDKIAVGADIKDGFVAIKGWTERSGYTLYDFCKKMQDTGVSYLICTDISKDGAMNGTNREMYKTLSENYSMNITASGGVSSLADIYALNEMKLYGAIIGKAYYTGDINLRESIKITESKR